MATSRANIRSELSLDTSKFSAALRRAPAMANRAMDRVGKSVAKVGASMLHLTANTVKWGGAIAAVGIAAAGARMLKLSADAEKTSIAFKVMTGSAANAEKTLSKIRDFAASTPFGFADLSESVKILLSFGVAADDSVDALKRLGDISGGDAEKLKSLSLVFGQISANGRLTGGDLLQLINVGFNPLNQIAARTGETMTELRKRMSRGEIGFDEFAGAVKDATDKGGLFFGMLGEQSQTSLGLLSTLTDAFDSLLLKVGAPINDAIKPILERAIELTEKLAPMAEALGDRIAGFITNLADAAQVGQFGALLQSELEIAFVKAGEVFVKVMKAALAEVSDKASDEAADWVFERVESFKDLATVLGNVPAWAISGGAHSLATGMSDPNNGIRRDADGKSDPAADAVARRDAILSKIEKGRMTLGSEVYGPPEPPAGIPSKAPDGPFAGGMKEIVNGQGQGFSIGKLLPFITKGAFDIVSASQRKAAEIKSVNDRMAGDVKGGFFGLASGRQMQLNRLNGIGPGVGNIFAQDRARLGISEGLQTGGLGAKRKVGREKSEEELKRQAEYSKSSNEHLMDIKNTIGKALTVA